jgi:predicted dehydrogenase
MNTPLSRRLFLKRGATAAALASASRSMTSTSLGAVQGANERIQCVQIGCGGRAMAHLDAVLNANKQHVVGIVDVMEPRFGSVKDWMQSKGHDASKVQTFVDYRRMFDRIGKEADAVFIATPNHHHALPSLIALQLGIAVYCEKPVCHDIGEARRMRKAAATSKVATQMGNQGHAEEGYRRLCEYIWAGTIGKVTETHSWTNRANGGVGPRPPIEPVPAGMHWDEYIGPAPYREFHSDIHPHEWHGWYDFGNGSIGNMGCHVLDGVFWALKIDHPTSIEAEQIRGGSDERYPTGSRIRWDIPAREDMPAMKAYWYEGLNMTTKEEPQGALRAAVGDARNLPELLLELRAKYPDDELDRGDSGTLYVGEKGVIYTATYGGKMHIVPYEKMDEVPAPPKTLPRPKNVITDFIDAIKAGSRDTAVSFDYGTRLTEFTLLGNLAQKAGVGNKIAWDGPDMKVKNLPDLNAWVARPAREGWSV